MRRLKGVALVVTMITLAIGSAVVMDFGQRETIRYKLAVNHRDALQAELLAQSGLDMARLILMVQEPLQALMTRDEAFGAGLPADTVWEVLPLNSDLLRQVVNGDLFAMLGVPVTQEPSEDESSSVTPAQAGADMDSRFRGNDKRGYGNDKEKGRSTFTPPVGGFGAFPESASFNVKVEDETGKISLQSWAEDGVAEKHKRTADLLYALFAPPRYDDLFQQGDADAPAVDRWELVGNLYDWTQRGDQRVDPQAPAKRWGTAAAGSKSALYASYDHVRPKNAYYDSQEELRLVHGMTDTHMSLFGNAVTIHGGKSGKVNLRSAKPQVIQALMQYCAKDFRDFRFSTEEALQELMAQWEKYLEEEGSKTSDGLIEFLKAQEIEIDEKKCKEVIGEKSEVFTVRSTGQAGQVSRTLTFVVGMNKTDEDVYYFRIQ
ncbi:MAG: hypothetical protein AAF471_04480 [Myxococcota bacterium]